MNNFDTSTNGVNLELFCEYDSYLSYTYFEENIDDLNGIYFFNNCEQRETPNTFLDLIDYKKMKKKYLADFVKDCVFPEYEEKTKQDYIDTIYSVKIGDEYPDGDIDKAVKSKFSKYDIITVKGYSQGDVADVLILKEDNVKGISDYIEHLFFDAPVYCRLMIDGDKYFLDEYLDDIYVYDKEKIIAGLEKDLEHEKKDYIIQWTRDNLPEYPEYK